MTCGGVSNKAAGEFLHTTLPAGPDVVGGIHRGPVRVRLFDLLEAVYGLMRAPALKASNQKQA